MLFWIIIKVSLRSLWAAKLRSFLAILGIVMGVGAVIAMLSIIEGARIEMQSVIGDMGTDTLFVWPAGHGTQGKHSQPELKLDDALAILHEAGAVLRVSPQYQWGVFLKNGSRNARAEIYGVAPSYFGIRNMSVLSGRLINDTDVDQGARVAILGTKAAAKIFGSDDPLGQSIKINQLVFRVIGILKSTGGEMFGSEDDHVIAPYTTVQQQIIGRRADLDQIAVQAASTGQLGDAENQMREILRRQHRLRPDEQDDFAVFNQARLLEMRSKALSIFGIVLGGVGGICLFTGGIGIMNIMLVIVTERTREIGVRKAIGAKNRDILTQFLLESILMSIIGGLIGIAGGAGLSLVISSLTPLKTVVSLWSIALALTFAAGIGIFFGYYPALRAARLNPIDSLQFE